MYIIFWWERKKKKNLNKKGFGMALKSYQAMEESTEVGILLFWLLI